MKRKSIICLTLAFLLIFSVLSLSTSLIHAASSAPVLSIVPTGDPGAAAGSTTLISAQAVGSTFSVDVRVDNYASVNLGSPGAVDGISGASYVVTWNPAVLNMTTYIDGSWLPDQSNPGDLVDQVSQGQLTIGQIAFNLANSFATADSKAGSVSATITFQVLSTGSTPIALSQQSGVSYLVAPETAGDGITSGSAVPGTLTANAQYGTPTNSSVFSPTASFTPADGSTFQIGSTITLNAASSTSGNDTQTCPITNYAWSIEYLNGTTFTSLTGENATFTANVLGPFRIILIVIAPDVASPPNPNYISTSSTSAVINVVSSLQSVNVDVYTNEGGVGEGVGGGTYGPLQMVQAYASVTSGNIAMPEERVEFTTLEANGTIYSSTQGVTNQTGIAAISFRLPSPSFGSSQTGFGTWSITGVVDVSGVTVNDTVPFTFSYLSGIENITIPSTISRGETLQIQLTINNQDLSAQWSQLSITIFDNASVPISSSTIAVTQQIQYITVVNAAILIPSWAFTGTATAYFCLLSNSTSLPLAPESLATFNILS